MTTTLEAIYENGKLLLPQRLPLPEKAHVRVTIESGQPQSDAERDAWLELSGQSLMRAWSDPADEVFNELLAE